MARSRIKHMSDVVEHELTVQEWEEADRIVVESPTGVCYVIKDKYDTFGPCPKCMIEAREKPGQVIYWLKLEY